MEEEKLETRSRHQDARTSTHQAIHDAAAEAGSGGGATIEEAEQAALMESLGLPSMFSNTRHGVDDDDGDGDADGPDGVAQAAGQGHSNHASNSNTAGSSSSTSGKKAKSKRASRGKGREKKKKVAEGAAITPSYEDEGWLKFWASWYVYF